MITWSKYRADVKMQQMISDNKKKLILIECVKQHRAKKRIGALTGEKKE